MAQIKTRQELIEAGKIWVVYPDGDPDNTLFEGTKTACMNFVKSPMLRTAYKYNRIRIAKLIYEPETTKP